MPQEHTFSFVYDSPIGPLGIRVRDDCLCGVDLSGRATNKKEASDRNRTLQEKISAQLARYFSRGSSVFSLPLTMSGTPFQKRVWDQLKAIPPGQTRTYDEIAQQLGSSARAVGNACRNNPVPVIVPCHRVVSASGIGGFSGQTKGRLLDTKRWLLKHEGVDL